MKLYCVQLDNYTLARNIRELQPVGYCHDVDGYYTLARNIRALQEFLLSTPFPLISIFYHNRP